MFTVFDHRQQLCRDQLCRNQLAVQHPVSQHVPLLQQAASQAQSPPVLHAQPSSSQAQFSQLQTAQQSHWLPALADRLAPVNVANAIELAATQTPIAYIKFFMTESPNRYQKRGNTKSSTFLVCLILPYAQNRLQEIVTGAFIRGRTQPVVLRSFFRR